MLLNQLLRLLFCVLAISAFAVLVTVNSAQTFTVADAVQTSQRVYVQLKSADQAGANITLLAGQYNVALQLIDQAQRLESSGDYNRATSLATQATNILETISPQADKLRTDAMSHQQTAATEQKLAIPIEAFAIALTATVLIAVRRRVKFKQISEMRVVTK